ncbi:fimbria/pilus outer membrane usher protein [Acidovorax sp. GBBC 3334]|uniref:fimbria/pilus outer membrane usher protein n=1 Tax=Acidovorax sp. GBBC 3334 TaxID=2940496 RepID=UPI002304A831|nr:fimbria/pilus outer membrane usher protein [Acidovorax sp. GBBC 3334]MDA8456508.1 fimbria/pilus outer membrane usher protein [Acidovorax sp. GBBC 3334]
MPRNDPARRRRTSARAGAGRRPPAFLALLACLPRLLSAGDHALPPPAPGQAAAPAMLYLEVDVNGRASGELVAVRQRGPHFEIDALVLRRLHVRTDRPDGTLVAVDGLPGVTVAYDSLAQRLRIDVPPEWLPGQVLGAGPREDVVVSQGTGLLMNYELYATRSRGRTAASVWSEQRFFGSHGVVSNMGILRRTDGGAGDGYLRYDTAWTDTNAATATSWAAGDLITGALAWTTPVRLGGVQWARNFAARPDLVTYPMPEFAGQAAVPSAVDVFVNGFRAGRHNVQPGPFTLGDLPAVSGAGTASVVTTDALGRQVVTSVPFYVSSQLLRPGWTDYSVSLGALRRAYGLRSFAYGRPLAAGVVRRGLTDAVTVEGQAQAGQGLAVVGAGGVARWGTRGVFNGSLSHGRSEGAAGGAGNRPGGWQWSAGYQYHTTRGGVSLLETRRTPGFGDAGDYGGDAQRPYQRTRQINASLVRGIGSLGAGWIDLRGGPGTARSRIAYASYSVPVGREAFFSLTAGRTVETGETQLRVQLTYLLDPLLTAQAAATRTGRAMQGEASLQRSLPSDGGLGWHLGHTRSGSTGGSAGGNYRLASAQYQGRNGMVQGGLFGTATDTTHWAGASGSLGLMDGYAFAANRVTDGFALVSTEGTPDVPITFNHQPAGTTDAQGYLLVPNVPAYYPARYAIDPLSLPADVHTPELERRVAVARGTGTLVHLPVLRMRTATITLLGADGKPLPPGSAVVHEQGRVPTVVGWDGVVYLTALHPRNTLAVRTPDGRECRAAFDEADHAARRDLRVVCRAGAEPGAPGAAGSAL